jgi:hypothetical protein
LYEDNVSRFQAYVGRFDGFRGAVGGLPGWAKAVVFVFSIPGLLLAALSIGLFLISMLALLVLAAPVYNLLRGMTRGIQPTTETMEQPGERRQASARVIDTDLK